MEIIERHPTDKITKPEFGILILALGDPRYAEYAVNLAASIRYVQPETQIALVYTDSAMIDVTDVQKTLFNYRIHCPLEYYSFKEGTCYVKAKLFLNSLTPFKKTLFLDADIIWSPYHKPSNAVQIYKDRNFTIANRGLNSVNSGFSDWIDYDLIKTNFGIEKWYDLSSEWIYFDDSESVNQLFESAREFYEDDKLICKAFAGGKPDEPALTLAMLKHDMRPHAIPYYPTYWEPVQKIKPEQDIYKNYYAVSMGGKFSSERMTKVYNNLAKVASYHTGIPTFPMDYRKPKGKILKERELI